MSKGKKKKFRVWYRKARRPFEWLAIWLAVTIIPRLSMKGALRLARLIAATVYLVDKKGKAISRANVRVMFPHLSDARTDRIVRGSYRNMARVLVMIFWMGRHTRERIKRWVTYADGLEASFRESQPCVTVSAHVGNWEILSQTCVAYGYPMTSVAKQIGSPAMTEGLTKIRAVIGQQIVPAAGAMKHLMKALKNGGNIGLLVDQHVDVWQGGAWVTFFGLDSGVSLAPAALALKLKVPVIFAWSRPFKDGRYRIEPGERFLPQDYPSPQAMTQAMVTAFERVIRRHPSLWCLNYRRWRYMKNGTDHPDRYPYYAKPERKPKNQG